MFSVVSIDDAVAEITISSYVDDSFTFTSSFLICKFLLSKRITIVIRKTEKVLTISKITIRIVAVKNEATPLIPRSSEIESNNY